MTIASKAYSLHLLLTFVLFCSTKVGKHSPDQTGHPCSHIRKITIEPIWVEGEGRRNKHSPAALEGWLINARRNYLCKSHLHMQFPIQQKMHAQFSHLATWAGLSFSMGYLCCWPFSKTWYAAAYHPIQQRILGRVNKVWFQSFW